MTNKLSVALSLAAALAVAGTCSANEIVLTQGLEKGGANLVALDFMNSGQATAFEFEIPLEGSKHVDTSKCLSELPKTHTGACSFNARTGRVVVVVYSGSNDVLPQGMVSLGKLRVPGMAGKSLRIEKLLVADRSGQPLPASAADQAAARDIGNKKSTEEISNR